MYDLYFENSNRILKYICEVFDYDNAVDIIKNYCNERNFKVYYVRSWHSKDRANDPIIVIDVGSHTEFFILYEKNSNPEKNNLVWG